MAKEVRCVLFSPDEFRSAVTGFLIRKIAGLDPYDVTGVELVAAAGAVSAQANCGPGHDAPVELDSDQLMVAVLMFCRRIRVPLSSRANKRLEIVNGRLALTTSLNLDRDRPRVEHDTIVHTNEADREFARTRPQGDLAALP